MPVVPSYGAQQVALSAGNAPQVRNAMTPEVLGESARGDADLARNLGHVGNAMAQLELQTRAKEDEAQTKRAYVQYNLAADKISSDFKNKQGLNASQDELDTRNKTLTELRADMAKNMGNADQSRMFDLATVGTEASAGAQMYVHRADQMELARIAETKAVVEVEANKVVRSAGLRNNTKNPATGTNLYDDAQIAYKAAWMELHKNQYNPNDPNDNKAMDAKFQADVDKNIHAPVVLQMLANGSPSNAQKYVEDSAATMSAETQAELSKHIQSANENDMSLRLFLNGVDTEKKADAAFKDKENPISVGTHDKILQRIHAAETQNRTSHAAIVDGVREQAAAWLLAPENLGKSAADMPMPLRLAVAKYVPALPNQIQKHEIQSSPGVKEEWQGRATMEPATFVQQDLSKIEGLSYLDQMELGKAQKKIREEGAKYGASDQVRRISAANPYLVDMGIKFSPGATATVDANTAKFASALQTELVRRSTLKDGTTIRLSAEEENKAVAAVVAKVTVPGAWFGTNQKPTYAQPTPAVSNQTTKDLVSAYQQRYGAPPSREILLQMQAAAAARAEGSQAHLIPQ